MFSPCSPSAAGDVQHAPAAMSVQQGQDPGAVLIRAAPLISDVVMPDSSGSSIRVLIRETFSRHSQGASPVYAVHHGTYLRRKPHVIPEGWYSHRYPACVCPECAESALTDYTLHTTSARANPCSDVSDTPSHITGRAQTYSCTSSHNVHRVTPSTPPITGDADRGGSHQSHPPDMSPAPLSPAQGAVCFTPDESRV
ncbi:hypothetical protein GDO81_019641 [Engystomops pustulosus]|uniref:Uncharacterized protein n=1 Tax=Engystomops pustulosus TaxID=76066 RepID=A0AAV6YT73_ENGPU|nr:hypothetical protein GDO81_019641 [Engystomops pustulosus]